MACRRHEISGTSFTNGRRSSEDPDAARAGRDWKEPRRARLLGSAAQQSAAGQWCQPTRRSDEQDLLERYQPFEKQSRYSLHDRAAQSDVDQKFFSDYYFGPSPDPDIPDQSWRRIDDAYMDAAAEFALQLDSATNNTSLVLALELVDSGKVLLFAAAAQVGNWLSWQDLQWKLDPHTTVTGPELLRRTMFYKVGHHGSHNATLRAKGLECMQSTDLVAFVPVDHKMAVKKGWGKMPLEKLMTELSDRTKGRVVRADQKYEPKTRQGEEFLKTLSTGPNELFYEWSMTLS